MNCLWEDVPDSKDARGWRRVQCVREGCGLVSALTPHPHHKIYSNCRSGRTGPGTELGKLIDKLGYRPDKCRNSCQKVAKIMDRNGVDWCKANKPRLVKHLKKAYSKLNWTDVAAFAARAVASGLAFNMLAAGPAEWLVDEAIRRAEAK